MSRTLIRANLEGAADAAAALKTTNRIITANAPSSMFVTVFVAVLDPVQRTFECFSAGHNPPLIVKGSTGEARYLHAQGIAMGVLPEIECSSERIGAEPGDLLILYTDGATEAFNDVFNAFGEERLALVAQKSRDLPAAAIRDRIISAIREFAGGAPQSDDITLVVIRIG